MIELSAQQQLSLLFPKSNRAIIETLEKASPEQLQKLSEAKDLKSVITGLMNDSLDVSKSNKIILDILKNSAFFKELGTFPKDLKTLVDLLNEQPSPGTDKTAKALQSSLLDISDTQNSRLKEFVKNSGIFLESRLAQGSNPKQQLKSSLEALQSMLLKSELPHINDILKDLGALLKNTALFEQTTDVNSLSRIKNDIDKLLSQLKDILRFADPIYSKSLERSAAALEKFSNGKDPKADTFSLDKLRKLIDEIASELRVSAKQSSKLLLSELQAIQDKVKELSKGDQTLSLIKDMLKETENINSRELRSNIEKLKLLSQMRPQEIEALNQGQLKAFFTDLAAEMTPTASKSLFDIIEKILGSLRQPLAGFEQQKLPQNIKTWLNHFDKEASKGDIVYSKALHDALEQIERFSKPAHLLKSSLLNEELQKDMKALLLGLEKEFAGNTPNIEILKAVDKLLVQIDYFQLLSHLSNASYLYIPYVWDQLENGSLSFKKSKDGSSYCEIDLELSEYGRVNMMLQLFEDNQLNIMIYTQKSELKELFKENMKTLRSALVGVNIMPRKIHLHDLHENTKSAHPYENATCLNELGFEAKG